MKTRLAVIRNGDPYLKETELISTKASGEPVFHRKYFSPNFHAHENLVVLMFSHASLRPRSEAKGNAVVMYDGRYYMVSRHYLKEI